MVVVIVVFVREEGGAGVGETGGEEAFRDADAVSGVEDRGGDGGGEDLDFEGRGGVEERG